jgi:AsmA family/AsmA-like C-terminal region
MGTQEAQLRQPAVGRRRLRLILMGAAAILAAVVFVPSLISIGRYKGRITELIAASLGRPVRLSSVELRLFPWPGFVLTDLSVAEDAAYGAEPVLHANSVTASIRLLPLWRGRLEIGSISVDEASLNLVRAAPGRWNLDPLFRSAAKAGGSAGERHGIPLPSLEATNSRINFKDGAEKLPFSLVNTDLSFWQEGPGVWRVRLRGQPARTDVSLDMADTGIVRLEATLGRAPRLLDMPVRLDLDWRQAQLGQLSRLLTGSDAGWRGDLTGNLRLEGSPGAARVTMRLRASGVRRAEFAPAEPMDFDANCAFVYHYFPRALDHLGCNSPLGDGRLQLTGDLSGEGALPHFSLLLDRVPVAAGLDLLRTLRKGFASDLEAAGVVSGKISYAEQPGGSAAMPTSVGRRARRASPPAQSPLTGSLAIQGFRLSGGGLSQPIRLQRIVLEPVSSPADHVEALNGTAAVPGGEATPIVVNLRLDPVGYRVTLHGPASLARTRELAHAAGLPDASALDDLSGGPANFDLEAEGPWMPRRGAAIGQSVLAGHPSPSIATTLQAGAAEHAADDSLTGTVTLHNATWKADYLANRVEINQATLHLGDNELRWDPVAFSFGPVKGTAALTVPSVCPPPEGRAACLPQFEVQFARLDAAVLQAALLGAKERGTILSAFITRLHLSSPPVWPQMEGTVEAGTLVLGPVTLHAPSVSLRISPDGAEFSNLTADVLGGHLSGSGALHRSATDPNTPDYTLDWQLDKMSAPAVGELLGLQWSGGTLSAAGKVDLSGFTSKDLAESAKGDLHFEWLRGTMPAPATEIEDGPEAAGLAPDAAPAPLHFRRWTAEAEIADGALTLKNSRVFVGSRAQPLEASLTLTDPSKLRLMFPKRGGKKP